VRLNVAAERSGFNAINHHEFLNKNLTPSLPILDIPKNFKHFLLLS
jgi:hypothetical protein